MLLPAVTGFGEMVGVPVTTMSHCCAITPLAHAKHPHSATTSARNRADFEVFIGVISVP
jgi:hypothetical protein